MRELERNAADTSTPTPAHAAGSISIGIVGAGRVGKTLVRALRAAGREVDGPAGRGEVPSGEAILLCVPDAEIPAAAAAVAGAAPLVGHSSGATPLSALAPAGDTPAALTLARRLAIDLGMEPIEIADTERGAYHAAASIASNFLLTLEAAAETVAGGAGIAAEDARRLLGPLVRTTVENWLAAGPRAALTGPVARGDERTVTAQRAGVAATAPELLPLFDELVERTRALAGRPPLEVVA